MRYTLSKKIIWSNNLAYAIGLIASDGNLSSDLRHINLTSKDLEQINNFQKCFSLHGKIGEKKGGFSGGTYYFVQFSDVALYDFLIKIGLSSKKSLSLGALKIPNRYFFHFLRGSLDGDGCTYSYYDKRWKKSFMIYTQFSSASRSHLEWMQGKIECFLGSTGRIKHNTRVYNLTYAKKDSILLFKEMYKNKKSISLSRKREKVFKSLAEVAESVYAHD